MNKKIYLFIFSVSLSGMLNSKNKQAYFDKEPFVHPRAIESIANSIDYKNSETVINTTVLYKNFPEIIKTKMLSNGGIRVGFSKKKSSFEYIFLGTLSGGIDVLMILDCCSGSSVFKSLLIFFPSKKVKEIILGDRWDGDIILNDKSVEIRKDKGPLKHQHFKNEKRLFSFSPQ